MFMPYQLTRLLVRLIQPRSQALSPLPSFVIGRKTLVTAGHITTCDTNFSIGVESTNNFCRLERQSLVIAKFSNHTWANTSLKHRLKGMYLNIYPVS